ncbi:hypothetical protein B0T24DRAFT_35719 [Lasiosphaeria ovina]|uniref:Uncharacterized protein n=1 Tax=Lasiosphaeria ovina TaxID=92902 RepID=A0AAE0TXF9_9PEZI|nr:hypothetical protein B0T24DRAFT_35719 [Lasiosphaeria ovina]
MLQTSLALPSGRPWHGMSGGPRQAIHGQMDKPKTIGDSQQQGAFALSALFLHGYGYIHIYPRREGPARRQGSCQISSCPSFLPNSQLRVTFHLPRCMGSSRVFLCYPSVSVNATSTPRQAKDCHTEYGHAATRVSASCGTGFQTLAQRRERAVSAVAGTDGPRDSNHAQGGSPHHRYPTLQYLLRAHPHPFVLAPLLALSWLSPVSTPKVVPGAPLPLVSWNSTLQTSPCNVILVPWRTQPPTRPHLYTTQTVPLRSPPRSARPALSLLKLAWSRMAVDQAADSAPERARPLRPPQTT